MVGADTLLIECARIVLDRGHDIVSIAAGSERVKAWAVQAGLPSTSTDAIEAWGEELRQRSVDYVFAITHLHLLPASVIGAAQRAAINFHDGPLPEYAGLNTPVWGILRGEREWGISWHVVDGGVDTGEVLVQRRFEIAERETSLSLNTRNIQEALESFGELLDRLEANNIIASPQDREASRHVFRRADRPDGVLDFDQPAADVDRVVRALHFGPHPNPVAAAVLWHPVASVVVGASELCTHPTPSPAGTVLAADATSITVACASDAVRLFDLRWLNGTPCDVTAFQRATGVAVGGALPGLSSDDRRWLADLAAENQRHELATIAALSALAPAEFPWPTRHSSHGSSFSARSSVAIPLAAPCDAGTMVIALTELLTRWSVGDGMDVALAHEQMPEFARSLICSETVLRLGGDVASSLAQTTAPGWFRDVIARTPRLAGRAELADGLAVPIGVRLARDHAALSALVVLQPSPDDGWELDFDNSRVDVADVVDFASYLAAAARAEPADQLLPTAVFDRVVRQWNATDSPFESVCVHELISRQAAQTPNDEAVVCGDDSLTYAELMRRSSRLAAHLQQEGVKAESFVGVHVDRSVDLVVAVVAVLCAGGAYVPLDPAYPAERLRHMIADSGARVVVCQQHHVGGLPLPDDGVKRTVISVDDLSSDHTPRSSGVEPENAAYCIYTSGSTGAPKGVVVEHRNVANLFAAMDTIVPRQPGDTWFAVTSLSFDISVLELLYTLARGIRVVIHAPGQHQSTSSLQAMDFSLFYFAADESADGNDRVRGKYRLLLEGARFADANGFAAVWTPERHFHAFGGLYPNPAVTSAAIAAITERVAIRGGSVVLPLHHPVEIAEAWSVVDNLSNGRVGIAFASGWQPNDFILRPQNFEHAKETMFEGIDQVRRLWRGESIAFDGPDHTSVGIATLPRPVQPELPTWITTAGNRKSFAAAGTLGANVLTHLVGQSIEQLAPKIAEYRAARAAAGHDPATGVVTLMLHTFVGDDDSAVRETVHQPLRDYLNSSFSLLRDHAWAFPTFRRADGAPVSSPADLVDEDLAKLSGAELDAVLDFAAERYHATSGLFGTPEHVLELVDRLHEIGVNEIACLVDFGIDTETVLAHLPHLARVRELATTRQATQTPIANGASVAEQIVATGTTHLQCTPSMARMFTLDPAMRAALSKIGNLLVGGETLPTDLASELRSLCDGDVTNMYGPTETTVWSSTSSVIPDAEWVSIGRPIANTYMYVLDATGYPTPPGVAGQLWIGGAGVTRGYHQQPQLTAERFRQNPFRADDRIYCTGDLARWRSQPDGSATLEFLGRRDQQVKLRGHRIELGEVEAAMRRIAGVVDCAATIEKIGNDDSDRQLVAFIVTDGKNSCDPKSLRETLRSLLPDAMVPSRIVDLPSLPRTPNGKLDRRALPHANAAAVTNPTPPSSDVEHQILREWGQVLGTDAIGVDDNFFDVGGHSLLVVRLHRQLQQTLARNIALTDLYRFPTVRAFVRSLINDGSTSPAIEVARERAARRRAAARGTS